jgi:hypothetical protein
LEGRGLVFGALKLGPYFICGPRVVEQFFEGGPTMRDALWWF